MNKVIMTGRLTKNPDIRKPEGEGSILIANFTIAVNRKIKNGNQEETDYFDCTAFDKLAIFSEKYLKQGSKILITGKLLNNNYIGKDTKKVYGVKIIIDEIEFAESRASGAARNQMEKIELNQVLEGETNSLPLE
jgi:single-strand DNA-binding protein